MIASVPAIVSYVLWIPILLQVKYTLTMTDTVVITGTSTLVKILSEFWQVSRYKYLQLFEIFLYSFFF